MKRPQKRVWRRPLQSNISEDAQVRRDWKNELKEGRARVLDLLKKERAARKQGDHKKAQKYSDELKLQLAVDTADWDWFDLVYAQMKCVPKELRKYAYGRFIWALVIYWKQCVAEESKWREIAEIASLERTGELSGPWELIKEQLTPETCRAEHRLRELGGKERGAEIERWALGTLRNGGKDALFLADKIAIAIAEWEKPNPSKRNTLTPREREALMDYRSDLKYSKSRGGRRHTVEQIKAIVAPDNPMTIAAFRKWVNEFGVPFIEIPRGAAAPKYINKKFAKAYAELKTSLSS
jgi:hypothetical protein